MSGSFTTVTIRHYINLQTNLHHNVSTQADLTLPVTLLGTCEDVPPIFISIIGGFLQQLFGPKKLLLASAIPSLISWIVVISQPSSLYCLLISRFLSGVSNGLLTGNVYLSHVATGRFIASLKMVEMACKNLGSIFMFILLFIPSTSHLSEIQMISLVSSLPPLLGLLGMLIARESPVITARKKEPVTSLCSRLQVPITSPTVYKPLQLISCLIILVHCSGAIYIKRFLLQILDVSQHHHQSDEHSEPRMEILAVIILIGRFVVILLMSVLLLKIRVRFLYFLSIFLTVLLLLCLGFVCYEPVVSHLYSSTIQYTKVTLLCLHVFFIQLGVNTLPQLLTDILFPSSCKAVMKGVTRAVSSLALLILINLFQLFQSLHSFSVPFWVMSGVLLLSSPLLYKFVPEIRNIGTSMATEFFLPSQTVFYFLLPRNDEEEDWHEKARTNWRRATRKISDINRMKTDKLGRIMTAERCSQKNCKVRFSEDAIEMNEMIFGDRITKERVTFISNLLGQGGKLTQEKDTERVLVGRGPCECKDHNWDKGAMFLFNDMIILAKCVVANRRYINEVCLPFSSEFSFSRMNNTLELRSGYDVIEAVLEDQTVAVIWQQYIQFCNTKVCREKKMSFQEVKRNLFCQTPKKLSMNFSNALSQEEQIEEQEQLILPKFLS